MQALLIGVCELFRLTGLAYPALRVARMQPRSSPYVSLRYLPPQWRPLHSQFPSATATLRRLELLHPKLQLATHCPTLALGPPSTGRAGSEASAKSVCRPKISGVKENGRRSRNLKNTSLNQRSRNRRSRSLEGAPITTPFDHPFSAQKTQFHHHIYLGRCARWGWTCAVSWDGPGLVSRDGEVAGGSGESGSTGGGMDALLLGQSSERSEEKLGN